jgi:ABC-2 type transport system permease protein
MKYFNNRNKAIVSELVRADFKIRYQGSVLGYAWSLLRPLLLFTVLYVIFVFIIPLGNSVEHFPVYLLIGVILWNFFSEATTQGITSVVARGDLIRKINIPKYLLVFSVAISALINLLFGLVVLIIFALLNGVEPSLQWIMIIPVVAEMFILAVGISFLLSSLYVKYRDISYIWEVVLQIGFYASAIIFPLSTVPEAYRNYFFLNPVVQIIQDARYFLATDTSITIWSTLKWPNYLMPLAMIAVISVIGGIVFKRKSTTFAEDI